MERKFKRIFSCLFGGRRKFKLRNLPSRTSSLLSVLLRTRSAQRLSSQHLIAVLTPNIPELVPSGLFCSQPCFLRRSEHIFPGKHKYVHVDRHLVMWKEISTVCSPWFAWSATFPNMTNICSISRIRQKANVSDDLLINLLPYDEVSAFPLLMKAWNSSFLTGRPICLSWSVYFCGSVNYMVLFT